MNVTIRDVAKEAQVSASTVSRVFNHGHLVKRATREHVRSVAQRMGYAPNAAAKSLSQGCTQTVGVIIPSAQGEFFSEFIRGVDDAVKQAEHHLLISSSHHSADEAHAALNTMAGRVDGLVVMASRTKASTWARWLNPDLPVVFANTDVGDVPYDAFGIENRQGAARIVRHLVELGRTRVAAVTGPPKDYDVQERLAGYRAVLRESGLKAHAVVEGAFTQKSGYEAGKCLARAADRPDALFAFNDYMAIGAMAAFQEAGLRVPQDIAVAGFDDMPSAHYVNPPLTTVRIPIYDLGRRAAQRLLEHLGSERELKRERQVLAAELKVRASTTG